MQNVLSVQIKENSVLCVLSCMTNMQNFLGFHAECFGCLDQRKLSFVYPFMHDQHAECSRFLKKFEGKNSGETQTLILFL